MPDGSSSSADSLGAQWREFVAAWPARVTACWQLKLLLSFLALLLFWTGYFLMGHYPLMPVHTLPQSWIDRWIGFHPDVWVWIYQSVYLPMNLIPWLSERREDLWRYVNGFAVLSLISFAIFIVYPVRGPMPQVTHPAGMYGLLLKYDVPLNAMPSLHAGLLIYTLAYGTRILGNQIPPGMRTLCVLWAGAILYATLATKQHYAVDIVAGSCLGLAIHFWIWRSCAIKRSQSSPLPASNVQLPARS